MNRDVEISTDILLLGGGHAHVHVMKAFAQRPLPGVRVTLITANTRNCSGSMKCGFMRRFDLR